MKKTVILFFCLIVTAVLLQSQPVVNKVFVISPTVGDGNLNQVEARYQNHPEAFYVLASPQNPMESFTSFLEKRQCAELHAYLPYINEALIFNEFSLTVENIDQYASSLIKWHDHVSEKIIIHSLIMAELGYRPNIVIRLEALTGLPVEIIQSY